jgi:hypothetical protein
MTLLSYGGWSYTKIDFHWLTSVNDTAESKLSGVNDTSEAWLIGAIDTSESWLSGAIDTDESWLSSVIGDLKLRYLGKLASFKKTILGYELEA